MNQSLITNPAIAGKLEELAQHVCQMKPGGDLEGLLEHEIAELKTILYQQAIELRKQTAAAHPADFPPSGLPDLPAHDAPKRP
jgi:hypothetical protein